MSQINGRIRKKQDWRLTDPGLMLIEEAEEKSKEPELRLIRRDEKQKQLAGKKKRTERRKADELRETLIGLGTYKEEEDLASFLSQFESIMREGEVHKKDWSVKFVMKLTPKLGEGVRPRLETGAVYEETKSYLLKW